MGEFLEIILSLHNIILFSASILAHSIGLFASALTPKNTNVSKCDLFHVGRHPFSEMAIAKSFLLLLYTMFSMFT